MGNWSPDRSLISGLLFWIIWWREASELLKDHKVATRVEELEEQARNMKPDSTFCKASPFVKK